VIRRGERGIAHGCCAGLVLLILLAAVGTFLADRALAAPVLGAAPAGPTHGDSELAIANAAAGREVSVSRLFAQALQVGLDAARDTDGLVDPTLGAQLRAAGYDRTFALVRARDSWKLVARPHSVEAWRQVELDAVAEAVGAAFVRCLKDGRVGCRRRRKDKVAAPSMGIRTAAERRKHSAAVIDAPWLRREVTARRIDEHPGALGSKAPWRCRDVWRGVGF